VGSNIGLFSIMAGKINPEMKVFAFDPSPGPFDYLSENVRINKLANVKPLQMALSNQNGSFSFEIAQNKKYSYLKYNSLGGSGHLSEARPGSHSKSITVEAQKLDDFVKSNRITRLDLLKLDVEEAEHLVLEGAPETLKQLRPIVVCEVFSTEMLHQIQKQWSDSEYHLFIFEHKKLFPFPYSESAKISRIENFFFVPSEKLSWLDSFIQA
jgi:FkbM family methyltransferase